MHYPLVSLAMRKVGELVVTLFVASVLIFSLVALVPGDPAAALAGGTRPNPETLAAIRRQFRLDDPIWQRYLGWIGDLFTGNLGTSFVYRANVTDIIGPRIGTSLLLVAYSALIILVVGVGVGVAGALGNRVVDRGLSVLTAIAMGAPTFVVAIFLISVFALGLGWFPVFGAGDDFGDQLYHLTLPAIAMSFAYFAFVARITRSSVRGEMFSEHVETARSRGLAPRQYIPHHVLRNASAQIFSVAGLTIASLFAATVVAEQAFGINGIGSLLVQSAARQDLPTVQIISLAMVFAFVVVNTVVDIVNAAIDPRTATRGRTA
ncbi:ABC transporter permease [Subtercola sp. YIM 133946]|uniref:ABC transporter permease n=1 Tax=Subtercola sp. YIM 133946 TaxID=3118909 RepID=UPI002F932744